ncbi:PREDICTED: uncharacterized protein LOC104747247 isoform X2 [Camelina sativa]|uniref:Uncharacterized protein LOC104747247 isoform X2 n=1 Tax=Camelina sativa TaxID=90675 RepID=A0ABM0W8B3_CAMSA|nr:PREDICTED: uncharacterized protein LOC104747247 isoform X2 [Camelina sativa]
MKLKRIFVNDLLEVEMIDDNDHQSPPLSTRMHRVPYSSAGPSNRRLRHGHGKVAIVDNNGLELTITSLKYCQICSRLAEKGINGHDDDDLLKRKTFCGFFSCSRPLSHLDRGLNVPVSWLRLTKLVN